MGFNDGYFTIGNNPYLNRFREVVEKIGNVYASRESTQMIHDYALQVRNF
jgi:hypothetical protein